MTIDFARNANVITAVRAFAKLKESAPGDPYVVDGYELHAHPDLVDRLRELATYTPEASLEFAFGIPLLCAPNGRVFATAGGTNSLSLFSPDDEVWGHPYPEYGSAWRQGNAWTTGRAHTAEDEHALAAMVRLAYVSAMNKELA